MNAPNQVAPVPFQPHGLVSLWDMLEIDAREFVVATQLLATIESLVGSADQDEQFDDKENYKSLSETLKNLGSACVDLSAHLTAVSIVRFLDEIEKENLTFGDMNKRLADIRARLRDELSETKFFVFDSQYKGFYDCINEYFGIDLSEKFSSHAAEDIEESGKCLALGRGTACVFHLMRAMEAAVQVLGAKLGVTNIEKEWGKILSDLHGKIEAMPKGHARDEWSACHANLYHVKQAWRNSTMHPKQTYTQDQAKEVFEAVRVFLEQMATLL